MILPLSLPQSKQLKRPCSPMIDPFTPSRIPQNNDVFRRASKLLESTYLKVDMYYQLLSYIYCFLMSLSNSSMLEVTHIIIVKDTIVCVD